jgi:antitoxin CcdA
MKSTGTHASPKRPFNLTLTAANVEQVKHLTGNLSATVDGLLADFVAREVAARNEQQQLRNDVCESLNTFNSAYGSFADEHSTL